MAEHRKNGYLSFSLDDVQCLGMSPVEGGGSKFDSYLPYYHGRETTIHKPIKYLHKDYLT